MSPEPLWATRQPSLHRLRDLPRSDRSVINLGTSNPCHERERESPRACGAGMSRERSCLVKTRGKSAISETFWEFIYIFTCTGTSLYLQSMVTPAWPTKTLKPPKPRVTLGCNFVNRASAPNALASWEGLEQSCQSCVSTN